MDIEKHTTLLIVLTLSYLTGFTQNNFSAQVNVKSTIDISSASCMEKLNGYWFIAGDDAPDLLMTDSLFNPVKTVSIFSDKHAKDGRIKKSKKPDFEAMVVAGWGNDDDLLIFGSGTSTKREIMIRVDVDSEGDIDVHEYDLDKFYKHLRNEAAIEKEELNIEGAALWGKKLLLLNRATNQIYSMSLKDFKKYVKDDDKDKPDIEVYNFNLPGIAGNIAGFSGAYVANEKNLLLFSASVENTPDWINDKDIVGSYIGIIDLQDMQQSTSPVCVPVKDTNTYFEGKIESVVCTAIDANRIKLVGVTDNDNGRSKLVLIEVNRLP